MTGTSFDAVETGLAKAGVTNASRHLFLCSGPDCCEPVQGQQVWEYLKQRVAELGLSVMRTKAGCFRVCAGGPWLVIYPEGVWYREVNVERCERILKEHILDGKPVQEWIAVQTGCGNIP